jgi:hypothetical protein
MRQEYDPQYEVRKFLTAVTMHYSTSRKMAGSVPGKVIGFFN